MSALKLPLILSTAIAIDHVRLCANAFMENRELAPDFVQAFGLAHAFTCAVDVIPVQELSLNLDPVLARALEQAHSAVRAHATEILEPGTSRERIHELARSLNIAPTLNRALRHAQGIDQDRVHQHARGLDATLIGTLNSALEAADALDFIPGLASTFHDDLSGPPAHPWFRDIDLALHLAASLSRDSHTKVMTLSFNIFRYLLSGQSSALSGDAEGSGYAALDAALRAVEASLVVMRTNSPAPEDPTRLVRLQCNVLMSATADGAMGQEQMLVEAATDLLMAIRDRSVPCDARALSSVRTALVASMIKPDVSDGRYHLLSGPLSLAWESLAALDTSLSRARPNQVLLLACTQS